MASCISRGLVALLAWAGAMGAMGDAVADTAPQDWHHARAARFAAYHRPSAPRPGAMLWDGADYPQMVVVPQGAFTMGSPPDEAARHTDEGPVHRVTIAYSLAVSKYPVTLGEFARFVAQTGYDAGSTCKTYEGGTWDDHRAGRNWRNPGFAQTPDDPVVCMNFQDANAYAAWLSKKTRHAYRLLSEAEYEYVNRAGTTTRYWWGDGIGGNHAPCTGCGNPAPINGTVPVGRYAPNPFGLHDTTGNAWSWVADCWHENYDEAPTDGSPRITGDCTQHAERGGAWYYTPGSLRSAIRAKDPADLRNYHNSFRLARSL